MTNIAGVPAFGGGGFAFRQPPDPPEPAVPQIAETALNGTATYTKGNELPGQNGEPLSYRLPEVSEESEANVTASEKAMTESYDISERLPEDVLTGPTPAFQASVLEVELDLRNTIAELAARRSQAADERAIAAAASEQRSDAPTSVQAQRQTAEETTEAPDTTAEDSATDYAEDSAKAQTTALSATPSEAQDPEAQYAGPAAVLRTPYDKG
ncbi:hypothetical protein [Celeribacter neptunius]|uniref:Uncharacterized protein n=1 Tax=Celeribacter neptunius TaxID=588602 RepID=A0A1I3N593_9RHOB|nr:hypothetical protein [Celeribacter neptunius]SFJ04369.1 hypothetical protein SAMN04487991_1264 [Celeribacter neptunius]